MTSAEKLYSSPPAVSRVAQGCVWHKGVWHKGGTRAVAEDP